MAHLVPQVQPDLNELLILADRLEGPDPILALLCRYFCKQIINESEDPRDLPWLPKSGFESLLRHAATYQLQGAATAIKIYLWARFECMHHIGSDCDVISERSSL